MKPGLPYLRFQARVLLPVVSIMVLLLAVTMWIVNQRFASQIKRQAEAQLDTSAAAFRNFAQIRERSLLLHFRNEANEANVKEGFISRNPATLQALCQDLRMELSTSRGADDIVVILSTPDRTLAAVSSQMDFDLSVAGSEGAAIIAAALGGAEKADIITQENRLLHLIALPVIVGRQLLGAVTFICPIAKAEVQEFKDSTHCEVVLLADGHVVASTLRRQLDPELVAAFETFLSRPVIATTQSREFFDQVQLDGQTFLCHEGRLPLRSAHSRTGFLLLSSYEQPLRELAEARQMLFLLSLVGILLSTLIVNLVVKKITSPLRALRDSAEAIGRGDFSRPVYVTSHDEYADLAKAFNRMSENVQSSRLELEKTVETLRNTQEQLVQREKLSAIGEFVAGVAHELNNPLTSVIGFAQLLQQTTFEPQDHRFLERVVSEAQRCARIVKSLLSFARQHPPERKLVNLNDCVNASLDILRYTLRTSGIEVATKLDPQLPEVLADSHQVQQVFVNIVNNARQAIELFQPSGCIKVATTHEGGRVTVTFQDNGPGISQENITKIFDPFFTTKEFGQGTGLGLSLSYGIIQQHGGNIVVRSRPGEGASFSVEMPVAAECTPEIAPVNESPTIEGTLAIDGLGKRLLIVDDEEAILELTRELLMANNYEVDTARDGQTALRKASMSRYDLIVCDMKMPGLSGRQVYERLCSTNPRAAERLIFMTGDVVGGRTQEFFEEHGIVCLAKPFTVQDFRLAVGRLFQPA